MMNGANSIQPLPFNKAFLWPIFISEAVKLPSVSVFCVLIDVEPSPAKKILVQKTGKQQQVVDVVFYKLVIAYFGDNLIFLFHL